MKSLINTLKKRDIKILDRCTNLILSYSYKGPVFSYHRGGGGGRGGTNGFQKKRRGDQLLLTKYKGRTKEI